MSTASTDKMLRRPFREAVDDGYIGKMSVKNMAEKASFAENMQSIIIIILK